MPRQTPDRSPQLTPKAFARHGRRGDQDGQAELAGYAGSMSRLSVTYYRSIVAELDAGSRS